MDQEQTIKILQMIAAGRSYEQIITICPELTYMDIFVAAAEALRIIDEHPDDYNARLEKIKAKHPMAYEPWTACEEDTLKDLRRGGMSTKQIAAKLQRQPSAISSRLRKLGIE